MLSNVLFLFGGAVGGLGTEQGYKQHALPLSCIPKPQGNTSSAANTVIEFSIHNSKPSANGKEAGWVIVECCQSTVWPFPSQSVCW